VIDEEEARADEGWTQLVDAEIEYFKSERVNDALRGTSDALKRIYRALDEAGRQLPLSPTAAQVFAASASEMVQRKLLFEPVLAGVVHSIFAVRIVLDATGRLQKDHLHRLLTRLLLPLFSVDLSKQVRAAATSHILIEAGEVARVRDGIVHHGNTATQDQAAQAIAVAEYLLEVFDILLSKYYLIRRMPGENVGILPEDLLVRNFNGPR